MVCFGSNWLTQLLRDWLTVIKVFVSKLKTLWSWHVVLFFFYTEYTVYGNISVLLCGWPFIRRPLFHSYFLFFSLSILFHDWQRAFLVNQPSLTWFQSHFKPYSSSSPHCSRWLSLSLLPSTILLLCYHLLADGQNNALIRLGLNAYIELPKYENSSLIADITWHKNHSWVHV